jgi:hypothetical protein
MGYIDVLKKKGSSDIKVAASRVTDLKKSQENKCAECKKSLRAGYYKSIKDQKTGKLKIICSDCLVQLAKRY